MRTHIDHLQSQQVGQTTNTIWNRHSEKYRQYPSVTAGRNIQLSRYLSQQVIGAYVGADVDFVLGVVGGDFVIPQQQQQVLTSHCRWSVGGWDGVGWSWGVHHIDWVGGRNVHHGGLSQCCVRCIASQCINLSRCCVSGASQYCTSGASTPSSLDHRHCLCCNWHWDASNPPCLAPNSKLSSQ